MRKIKLDNKPEKSAEQFFNDGNLGKNETLSSAESANVLKLEKEKSFTGERKFFAKLLKQIFLFLPGTFLLFFMSYGAAIIAMEIFVYRRALEKLPNDFPLQFALIGLIILLGTLMTWFGLGDIKNKKHLAIPASLIITGAMIGAFIKAAAGIFDLADKMLDNFSYLIYLFPFALIVPILAKGIVDRKNRIAG